MLATSVTDALWFLVAVAMIVGLAWAAKRIDPHWVAKDGRAFTCKIQPVTTGGASEGRWRDARARVQDDRLQLTMRGLGALRKRPFESHAVVGRSEAPPKRSAVFLVSGDPMWAVKLPAASKAVPVLESLIGRATPGE
jgi:hypothetical protein